MASSSLYEDVVNITYEYLGPAADRFVVRQIRNHLQKNPEELRPNDLKQLIVWIQLAMRLISSDSHIIDKYMADLRTLTQSKGPSDGSKTS